MRCENCGKNEANFIYRSSIKWQNGRTPPLPGLCRKVRLSSFSSTSCTPLWGAGSAEGSVDAANILKPALSRGEIQVVGATTLDEYRKYIEKDAALERRFQPVTVSPSRQNRQEKG